LVFFMMTFGSLGLGRFSWLYLVGITKPSAYTGCTTANELVAWSARVSNPSNQNNTVTAPKLVQYLIREKHWSPLEMVHVSMEIRTTRDIARQILRHSSFRFQEYSQRYADPTQDLGFVVREARLQDTKNR
jgi:thymidylate synthase (FAD)